MFKMQKAEVEDVEAIGRLVQSVYRGDSSLQGWTTEAHMLDGQRVDEEMLEELITKPHSVILQYQNNGELLASVHLELQDGKVHLGMLSVRAQVQGQKLGQKVLQFSEQFAKKEWSVSQMVIEVLDGRVELIAWYERRGFRKTGKTMPFPDNPRFGIPKKKNLFFYEMVKSI